MSQRWGYVRSLLVQAEVNKKVKNGHLNWIKVSQRSFRMLEQSGALRGEMAILACDMVYCCCKWLYFPPSEKPNSPGLHTHSLSLSLPLCWNRTWEAFPPTAHHHENLLTWQKALWWMTGVSRRLCTGALNYVLHSQIVVMKAFTGTAQSEPQARSRYQVRLLQLPSVQRLKKKLKSSATTTTKTGGVATSNQDTEKKTYVMIAEKCL